MFQLINKITKAFSYVLSKINGILYLTYYLKMLHELNEYELKKYTLLAGLN